MTTITESRAAILKVPGNWSQKIDISLDVSIGVLTTLEGVARISAVPFLSHAASIALSIVGVVQKMQNNKHGFKELAKDSCEIVYEIINVLNDISKIDVDLERNLVQLIILLLSINAFARKGASENFFVAMLRYNAHARRIREYQRRLYQAIQIFGLQSHIRVRKTVAQLAADQVAIANRLNSSIAPVPALPIFSSCMPPSFSKTLDNLPRASQNGAPKSRDFQTLSHIFILKHKTDRQKWRELHAKYGLMELSPRSTIVRSSSPPVSLIESIQAQTMLRRYEAAADLRATYGFMEPSPRSTIVRSSSLPASLIKSTHA